MTDTVIEVLNLSKSFRVYPHPKDMFAELLWGKKRHTDFAALEDISFRVGRGEIVGILGRNGAGKSTLLKLIAKTLEPSGGQCTVVGRVSALLELGTGFHPDYSGRDNIILGAICLGISRNEARNRLESIIEFAELGEVIDQPFRTYSSGMQARLTFATAVAITPDILIVDEALAVGDARFQLRCFDRIRQMREAGCTILFVSHSVEQVTALCTRAFLLEKGRLIESGEPSYVSRAYHRLLFGQKSLLQDASGNVQSAARDDATIMGNNEWTIMDVVLCDESQEQVDVLLVRKRYILKFKARGKTKVIDLCAGFIVRSPQGLVVFATDSLAASGSLLKADIDEELEFVVKFTCHLGPGQYFMSYGLAHQDGTKIDYRYDALPFSVAARLGVYDATVADLDAVIEVERRHIKNGMLN